ncbi:MAG: hypothetical protein U1E89_01215 [Burkholderiaceae bacterium]
MIGEGPRLIEGLDVLADVAAAGVPGAVARRDKLIARRDEALAMIRADGLLAARACWRVAALRGEPGSGGVLDLDGGRLEAPWLVPASGQLTGVACAVATLGPALEARVASLFAERRVSLAMALDGLANELLVALVRRVQDRMFAALRRRGLCMAGELRAGDPGLALQAQRTVLALAGAEAIGVTLTGTLMMNPTKTTSLVQAVGYDLPRESWSRCDACRFRERCTLAAQTARPASQAAGEHSPMREAT